MPALLRPLLLGLAVLLLHGCLLGRNTDGNEIDPGVVEQIVVGRSTRADVTALLGPPDEIIYSNKALDPLFESAYRYQRTNRKQTRLLLLILNTYRSDEKYDHVLVFFDERGVVQHMGVRLDADEAEFGMPW